MQPFDLSGDATKVAAEMARFTQAAEKPAGFSVECERRLAAYLFKHRAYVIQALQRQFPQTYEEIVPYVLPLTRMFVNERAKVFAGDLDFSLVGEDGQPVDAARAPELKQPEEGQEPDATEPTEPEEPASDEGSKELARAWTEMLDESDLALKLEREDRYVTLLGSSFLRWSHWDDGVRTDIAFPTVVDVVWDPAHRGRLDMAYGVRMELWSEPAPLVKDEQGKDRPPRRRWEFWCARPGCEQYRVIDSETGLVKDDAGQEIGGVGLDAFPYRDDEGAAIVPFVLFTRETGEFPPFTQEEGGLVDLDVAFAVELSNIQHVALSRGYGQLVIQSSGDTALGGEKPSGAWAVGPSRALVPPAGWNATILSSDGAVADLIAKAEKILRMAALMHGIPPGSVSLEARAASSGIALQIDLRPLIEGRTESIKAYRGAMRRCARVAKAVWNAYAEEAGEPTIPEDVLPRWSPSEIQLPVDPSVDLENQLARLKAGLTTRARVISYLDSIPMEEAQKLVAEIDAEEKPAPTAVSSGTDLLAAARARLQTPAAQRQPMPMDKQGTEPQPTE